MNLTRFRWQQDMDCTWYVWDTWHPDGSLEAQCCGRGRSKGEAVDDLMRQLAAVNFDDVAALYGDRVF